MSTRPPAHRGSEHYAPHKLTSRATRTAAAAVFTAHGWKEGEHYQFTNTGVSRHEVIIAPIVGGIAEMPGTGCAPWADQAHKRAWFTAARELAAVMTAAGWIAMGSVSCGTYFHTPSASAPEGLRA
ncbi:hypothetical protein [Streptomyces spectabilis]|uniref:Uncharacterized protein n=1 Tax=Streptomyces spectabilis TaxID=68270 RepID=A0A7W8B2V0_STRST|nr:hypothetical protein [Streptomyces spectabilis]MBB5109308.1 hypothetical protein [Streptomyces spectabilis]GGV52354.1 hypothetical protein GCM10010245_82370 [Streptomyces spectabilis]